MKALFEQLSATTAEFIKNADDNVNKGNKAAGVRARKASLELEKLMKEYRKRSIPAKGE